MRCVREIVLVDHSGREGTLKGRGCIMMGSMSVWCETWVTLGLGNVESPSCILWRDGNGLDC